MLYYILNEQRNEYLALTKDNGSTVGPGYCHTLGARAQYSIKRDIQLSGTD